MLQVTSILIVVVFQYTFTNIYYLLFLLVLVTNSIFYISQVMVITHPWGLYRQICKHDTRVQSIYKSDTNWMDDHVLLEDASSIVGQAWVCSTGPVEH